MGAPPVSGEQSGKGVGRILMVASLVTLCGAAGLVAAHFGRRSTAEHPRALADLLLTLETRGFRANPGFAGSFSPGTLVQVRERDSAGVERDLAEPIIVKWGSDCFPGQKPQESAYALTEVSGQSSDQLEVDGSVIDRQTPALSLKDATVANYRLRLGRPHLRTFAKGDVSGQFSKACVEALERAVAAGEPEGFHRLVIETVVVDSLEYEVEWKETADATSRSALADLLRDKLGAALGQSGGPSVSVKNTRADGQHSVLTASAEAVVAYRLRPVEVADVSVGPGGKKP